MVSQGEQTQVLVRILLRQKAELEAEAAERGISRSEYIRSILDKRHRPVELAERLEICEERIDELEEQLARRSNVEEEVDVLAKRVEETDAPAPPWPIRWYRWIRGQSEA